MAWIEAISAGRDWEEARDVPRIRQAFVTLATTREAWPAPRHLLDALPRVEQRVIGHAFKPASPEVVAQARAQMDEWIAEMERGAKVTPPPKPQREGPPLAEVEAELQQHYTDRKSAAGGPDA